MRETSVSNQMECEIVKFLFFARSELLISLATFLWLRPHLPFMRTVIIVVAFSAWPNFDGLPGRGLSFSDVSIVVLPFTNPSVSYS